MTTEGRLLEEARHEAMIFDDVDILLLQSSFSSPNLFGECSVRVAGPKGILTRVVCFLIVRHRAVN